jgi:hypothetical protein
MMMSTTTADRDSASSCFELSSKTNVFFPSFQVQLGRYGSGDGRSIDTAGQRRFAFLSDGTPPATTITMVSMWTLNPRLGMRRWESGTT